ncbi:MAG: translation initiation factor IF-2, partial [Nitrospira sp.]|nr:translation initiation factor IF-2 [Nitrospira sp.]
MRVFELAKQMGMTSKQLQLELAKMGVKVKNHMSTLEDADVQAIIHKHKPQPSAPSATPSSSSKKPSKLPGKKRTGGSETSPVASVAPLKRSHLLIKKRVVAEEPAQPESQPKPQAPPAHPVVREAVSVTQMETASVGSSQTVTSPTSVTPGVEVATPPGVVPTEEKPKEGEKTEEKKKTEKPLDLWKLEKKESPLKLKEKVKKGKKSKWNQGGETFDFKQELTRMQDFRPFHRRDDRMRGSSKKGLGGVAEVTKPRKKVIKLSPGLTVKEFSEILGQKASSVIAKLMEMGIMSTINQPIDLQTAALIAEEYSVRTEVMTEKTEEELIPAVEDMPASLVVRSPVVTIMGHVDHGKTSLLDAIRQTRVTDTEAGGITQHIGAYTVQVRDKRITFLDTPGHEAFTAMRARGAQVTDIVILVVAADDGVMPQTLEAINHAKAANVPIIVAINKVDKPEANPDRVRNSLAEQDLIPEAWGGQTIYVEVSAKKKLGLDLLLEMVLLQAEVLELKVNTNKPARGVIIEAKLDRGRGPVVTVLVQEGTLRVGDAFVTGFYSGKVRALIDDMANRIEEAEPSTPVEVIGLEGVPQAGDSFIVANDERLAKEIANARLQKQRLAEIAQYQKVSLEDIYKRIKEGTVKELNLILKADVHGSIEAVRDSMEKLKTDAVKVKIIHIAVGGITESDVLLAAASNAIIIGFNVRPEPKAQSLAEREKVDIRLYTVIYDAVADIRAAMEGLLEPTLKEKILGRAEVRKTFSVP